MPSRVKLDSLMRRLVDDVKEAKAEQKRLIAKLETDTATAAHLLRTGMYQTAKVFYAALYARELLDRIGPKSVDHEAVIAKYADELRCWALRWTPRFDVYPLTALASTEEFEAVTDLIREIERHLTSAEGETNDEL